jgi:hypothetical protein
MPYILINPNSGIMEFSTGVAGGSSFIPTLNFTGGSSYSARLSHDNFGGLNIVSYTTGSGTAYSGIERFSIDGNNGRLFSVTDNLSGSLFSVNDIAGLPIIEAFDDNTVVMGAYNRNDFVLTGNSLGLGGLPNTGTTKLYVSGNVTVSGNIRVSGNDILIAPANYIRITGNQTSIVNGTKYLADTRSASFGFNLPASPSTGNYLEFADPFYSWSGNDFILSGNGNNIEGENSPFTGDVAGLSMKSIFVGGIYGWRIV